MSVCVNACHMYAGACGGQKRALYPLELESSVAEGYLTGALVYELGFSERTGSEPSSQLLARHTGRLYIGR